MGKYISNDDLMAAIADPKNQQMISKVCKRYSNALAPSVLKSCGEAAVWRCLQSHIDGKGNSFTSSLYKFLHWECLRELGTNKFQYEEIGECNFGELGPDPNDALIVKELLSALPEKNQKIVVARYMEGRTLADIGATHNYSKQGIQNILTRSIDIMREVAADK